MRLSKQSSYDDAIFGFKEFNLIDLLASKGVQAHLLKEDVNELLTLMDKDEGNKNVRNIKILLNYEIQKA